MLRGSQAGLRDGGVCDGCSISKGWEVFSLIGGDREKEGGRGISELEASRGGKWLVGCRKVCGCVVFGFVL